MNFFFQNLIILRFRFSLYGLQVSMSLKTYKGMKLGIECTNFFLADLVFTSECPYYSRLLFSSFMHGHNFSKIIIRIKQKPRLLSKEFYESNFQGMQKKR